MKLLTNLILILSILVKAKCHCPHMMGMMKEEKPDGPSPPSSLPEGDKGWDFDTTGAPGAVPSQHYIQTTFIHRSESKAQKDYATLVSTKLREIRERLRQQARVTVDNELISCVEDSEHYRCRDFQQDGAYHYLVVEDSSNGAAVYSLEQHLNEKSAGTTEMAILDALSRHSPRSLVIYASPEAEHEIGFVRQLSAKDLKAASKPIHLDSETYSYTELNLIDTDLLELRSGDGLHVADHRLFDFKSQSEFSNALKTYKYVFVLFWTHVHIVSLHAFNLWARTSKISTFEKDVLLSHVECHSHVDFCHGLSKKDFHTVVAYRDGENVGSTYYLKDEQFYLQWLQLIISGPFMKLETEEAIKNAKKGFLLESTPHPVVIGTFPDQECLQFQHFSIACDRLYGRYHIAVIIRQGATATVAAYRPDERKKRQDYEGRFDPASLMAFISVATFPSVIDISNGFTTNLLFRQPRLVAVFVTSSSFDNQSYVNLATRADARKSVIFTLLNRDHEMAGEVLKTFGLSMQDKPQILLLDKLRIYQLYLNTSTTTDEIWNWIQTRTDKPTGLLSLQNPHPLRILQKAHVDRMFTAQDTIILPDETLYKDSSANANSVPMSTDAISGGCPFMAGGGGAAFHEEL